MPSASVFAKIARRRAARTRSDPNIAHRTFLRSTPRPRRSTVSPSSPSSNAIIPALPLPPPESSTADDGTERLFDVQSCHTVGASSAAGWQLVPDPNSGVPLRSRKANQDSYAVVAPFHNALLVAVFDGHGAYGRPLSQLVRNSIAPLMKQSLARISTPGPITPGLERQRAYAKCFNNAFRGAEELLMHGTHSVDHAFSGTTGTCLLLHDDELFVSWAGDSRAVLARRQRDGGLRAVNLSSDHKPSRGDEKKRVRLCGARVTRWKKNLGPQRVWLPNEWLPGLAMTRSIGDTVLSGYGVTAVPEVTRTRLGAGEEFVVAASDGVWEFMSSDEVVDFVGELRSRGCGAEDAARALVDESVKRWRENENVVDDTTAVVVYIDGGERVQTSGEKSIVGNVLDRRVLRFRGRSRRRRMMPKRRRSVGVPMLMDLEGGLHTFDGSHAPVVDNYGHEP